MMNEKTDIVQKRNGKQRAIDAAEAALRHDCTRLCERLSTTPEQADDNALRQDIADIAAKMLALTARREGAASPIPALLDKADAECASRSILLSSFRKSDPQFSGETLSEKKRSTSPV
jgi:hypothetical protein